ncbi:MAG: hypothetical protein MJ174_07785 [Treponema sp.]|nr:hypothetical protein [Treponema sp.]
MKKLFSVLAVLFVMGTTSIFALGIGAQAGYTAGSNHAGGALTFKLDKSPAIFAVDGNFWSNGFNVGATADYWLANPKIESTWGYFYGVGLAAGVGVYNDANDISVDLGPRAVVGTNIFLLDRFVELYAQAAWQPTFRIWVSGANSGVDPNLVCFPVNLGFRFWF